MDGDGDDFETCRGDSGGMEIRVVGMVGDGYKYLSTVHVQLSSLYKFGVSYFVPIMYVGTGRELEGWE